MIARSITPPLFELSSYIHWRKRSCAKCSSHFLKTRSSSGVRKNRKTWARGLSSNRACVRFLARKSRTPDPKPVPALPSAHSPATSASKPAWLPTHFRFRLISRNASGIGVIVDSSGHLGTTTSSARFKENIQPMDKASEAVLSLQPVAFRYKKELDSKGIPQFGLVAEQVEKVDPDLVAKDDQGKPYSVRYEAVNAMLLNEFLKEHQSVEELKGIVAEQEKEIKALRAQVNGRGLKAAGV